MRKKNILMMVLTLTVGIMGSFPVNVKAKNTCSETEIAKWVEESNARSNTHAVYEGTETGMKSVRASGNRLVASDVWLEYSGSGDMGFASGYTDVRTSTGANAYHYTRTEMRRTSKTQAVAKKTKYGYGLVSAETADVKGAIHWNDAYGKVFWGG